MTHRRAQRIFWPMLAFVSFVLHFVWEYLQCEAFFVHGARGQGDAMLRATLGDLVLTGIAYVGTALVAWNRYWPLQRWTPRVWLALMGMALALSMLVELHALGMDWWRYTERAPLLPLTPISAVPVAQLTVLFPLSFGLARGLALRMDTSSTS